MKVKHWARTVEVTGDYVVITFDGMLADPRRRKASPLALRLDGVLRIEQQMLSGEARVLRFVMSETQKIVALEQDPYVVKFRPVLPGYTREVVGFVSQVARAVVQARCGVGATGAGTTIDPLVTVNDLRDPKATPARADMPGTEPAETRPTATTASTQWRYKWPLRRKIARKDPPVADQEAERAISLAREP
jgi:hypothetical protein